MSEQNVKYYPEHRIYKPKRSNDGAASKLQLKTVTEKYTETYLFWVAVSQTGVDTKGNATFAWGDKEKEVTIKLEPIDIAEMLCVLTGVKEYVGPPPKEVGGKPNGLFHKNKFGNTSLQLSRNNDVFYFRLASKRADKLVAVQHTISVPEAEILIILLKNAISKMYNWA